MKKPDPQDSTRRNVQAVNKQLAKIKAELKAVKHRLKLVEVIYRRIEGK